MNVKKQGRVATEVFGEFISDVTSKAENSDSKPKEKRRQLSVRRDADKWQACDLPCQREGLKQLYNPDDNDSVKQKNDAKKQATSYCQEWPMREPCFEQALLERSDGLLNAGVSASGLKEVITVIPVEVTNHVASLHPDSSDRQRFYDLSCQLLETITGQPKGYLVERI